MPLSSARTDYRSRTGDFGYIRLSLNSLMNNEGPEARQ